MNSEDISGLLAPQLPPGILYPATAILILVLLFVFRRIKHRVAIFAIFAAWFRYVVQAYHTITHNPAFLGLSWNALGSVAVFALGLLLIRWRNLMLRFLLPVYLLIVVVVISGLANGAYSGIITVTVKYGYFIVVTLAVFEALERFGDRFMSKLLWAFTPPLLLQPLSVVFGISKVTDADGMRSYIGGYNHEAGFSVILATCFIVACFAGGLSRIVRNGLLLTSVIGIFLANYRTTIIAIAPMVIVGFGTGIIASFRRDQRMVVGMSVLALSVMGVMAASWFLQERFQDLAVVIESGGMIKPPADFTAAEGEILSGRPYIWSKYIYGYLNGGGLQHLIGFGPESWAGTFRTYAHNTLISSLYEYGPIGVAVVANLFVSMLIAAWRVQRGPRTKLLAAHVSFILLSMATMPLWLIEGNILYGVICGYTLYLLQGRREYADQAAWQQNHRGRFAITQAHLKPVQQVREDGHAG